MEKSFKKSNEKISVKKEKFRKKMKSALVTLDKVSKALESVSKCAAFVQSKAFKNAKIIFGFMPLKDEVDILPILRAALQKQKKVLLPKIAGGKMEFCFINGDPIEETCATPLGIYEPLDVCKKASVKKICAQYCANEIVVLVPGLAFTKKGFRLGRGGGYYDKFLAKIKKNFATKKERPLFVGVCYDVQIVKELPHEAHDEVVDCVMCDKGLAKFR